MEEDNVILNPEPTNEKPSLDLNNYEDKMEDAIPDIADPNWTEYVISKLTEDELYDGNHTYVAEEMTKVAPEDPTKITKVQLMFIDKLCQRNDINAIKAILKITKYSKIKNVEDMPYKIAIGVTKAMNDMQNGTLQITDDIMGYDPEWRKVNEG
jgi:hypothetical protein